MISRRVSLWQKAVAFAPALLLVVYLPGETLLRCQIDGMLRAACCCPQEAETQSAGPVVKAADCCNTEVTQNTPLEARDRDWQRHGPPRDGPPLVLLKHAFLI